MTTSQPLEGALIQQFVQLIAENIGLDVANHEGLRQKLQSRVSSLKLASLELYYHLLETYSHKGDYEWQKLAALLVPGDSYFWRDRPQFQLLQNQIIPELIDRRRDTKHLYIWSAGCATGEEPYSIAILLEEILPPGWYATILGTDINSDALEKARQAIYQPWSFREATVPLEYFSNLDGLWSLHADISQKVQFSYLNLIGDCFPGPVDLILCRHVLSYFTPAARRQVIQKFHQIIQRGGYLLTAPGEVHLDNRLFTRQAPGVYQKIDTQRPPDPLPLVPPPSPATDLDEAIALYRQKLYQPAQQLAFAILERQSQNLDAYYLVAKIYCQFGDYDQAQYYCQLGLAAHPLSPQFHRILAEIAEAKGDYVTAAMFWKKVTYLCPEDAIAHAALAHTYQRQGNQPKAEKTAAKAQQLLDGIADDQPLDELDLITAAGLRSKIQQFL